MVLPLGLRVFMGTSGTIADSITDAAWFRTLEAFTTLRLLRLARYFHGGHLLLQALVRSSSALIVPFYMLALNVMFFGGLLYALHARARGCARTRARTHATAEIAL